MTQGKEISIQIGKKLTELRKAAKITQNDMANYIGLSRPQYVNIEKGKSRTTVDSLYYLCCALGCSVSDVFPPIKKAKTKITTKTVMRMVPTKVNIQKIKLVKPR